MKGIKEPILPIFADHKLRTATEECQRVNPVFYLKSTPCPYAGCSTCTSVQRWRGEEWRMFWDAVQTSNDKPTKKEEL